VLCQRACDFLSALRGPLSYKLTHACAYSLNGNQISSDLLAEITATLDDPAREALRASAESDTKPALHAD
jgi:hypothetical protein